MRMKKKKKDLERYKKNKNMYKNMYYSLHSQNKTLSRLEEKISPQKVSLGDDYQYPIKGISEASYRLDLGNPLKMKEFLYVPGLKKNLLSISTLH